MSCEAHAVVSLQVIFLVVLFGSFHQAQSGGSCWVVTSIVVSITSIRMVVSNWLLQSQLIRWFVAILETAIGDNRLNSSTVQHHLSLCV
jgi:hypothetical protein